MQLCSILKRKKCKKDAAKTTTQLKLSNLAAALSWMENDAIKNLDDAGEKSLLIIPVDISLYYRQ